MNHTEKSNCPLVKLESVTLQIDDKLLFENTSWEIQYNQHWAVIGKNGSGKSIIVNAICRDVPVVRGKIHYFFGEEGNKSRPFFVKNEIVKLTPEVHGKLMREQSGYHQARWNSIEGRNSLTVSDFLSDNSHISEDKAAIQKKEIVDWLGIQYLLKRKILHLSDGESRKVLIARALMQSPELLILDEPFCGLDNRSRNVLKNALESLLETDSVQIILVTQRQEEIPKGITHVLCVDNNRVIDQGIRDKILRSSFAREVFSGDKDNITESISQVQNRTQNTSKEDSILVEMKNTSVSYGGVDVLRNINWTMREGENWAIIGPNGAGKSTVLSLILADNPQVYANEISIFGRKRGSGESIWEVKSKIGWLSPEIQLYYPGSKTCHEVVCSGFFDTMGLYRSPSEEQEKTADEFMSKLGVKQLSERYFGMISRGEQRMVLLARAMVKEPRLLIMDEPCQGLDSSHRTKIIELVDELCSQMSVSLIYVTHHFDEIPKAITHILKLREGRVEKSGLRQDVALSI